MYITGVTAGNGIKVYKSGNGTTTSDSEVQNITVTQAVQPTEIGKVDCTTSQQNDGQITGVDTTMEYSLSTDSDWKAITGNTVTGLANGTYEVRVKANGTTLASPAVAVTIGEHVCVAQGEWQSDGTNHWKLCACGAKVEEAPHFGGTATCTVPAVCEICCRPYGEKNPDNHTGEATWTKTATTHSSAYDCCGAVVVAEEPHEWENGMCSKCTYQCQHSGGKATCKEQATCEICKEKYGNLGTHTLSLTEKVEATCTTAGKEAYYTCTTCGKHFEDNVGNTEIANLDEYGIIPATGTTEEPSKDNPSTGETNSPQTGDSSNVTLWIVLMLAAGAVLTSTAVYSRKRKYNR